MACSFSASSATRLQAVDAAAAVVKNGRVPLNLKASVAPAQRSLGCCRATARQEGATKEPSVAGLENGTPPESYQRATIREQLLALANGKVDDEFTLPLAKRLKEGLKRLNSLTVSQRRNIKRQALLTQV
nr:unnamed protein product [Digitaria exilis]